MKSSWATFLLLVFVAFGMTWSSALPRKTAGAKGRNDDSRIDLRNSLLTVAYHRQTGKMDILWRDGHKLLGISSGARLANGAVLSTTAYSTHNLEREGNCTDQGAASDKSAVREYTIRSTGTGLPDILQHIWLYDDKPAISIEAELGHDASEIGARHFDAVVLDGANSVQIRPGPALRVLHVPFDNDMWFRYISWPVAEMNANGSYSSDEVTAIYDNESRQSLILGSIAHDTWKTAIDLHTGKVAQKRAVRYGNSLVRVALTPGKTVRIDAREFA
jgi:alpha-galactosidase